MKNWIAVQTLLSLVSLACCTTNTQWEADALMENNNAKFKEILDENNKSSLMTWQHDGSIIHLPVSEVIYLRNELVGVVLQKASVIMPGYDVVRFVMFQRNRQYVDSASFSVLSDQARVSIYAEGNHLYVCLMGGFGPDNVKLTVKRNSNEKTFDVPVENALDVYTLVSLVYGRQGIDIEEFGSRMEVYKDHRAE